MDKELRELLSALPKNKWLYSVKKQKLIVDWLNTKYLITSTESLAEKIYLFNNSLLLPPKCAHPNCNNLVKWISNDHFYPNCCCKKCTKTFSVISGEHKITLNKQQQTMLEKYGVDNASKSATIRDKIKKTNLEKYGVESPFEMKDFKEKQKNTWLHKYGVETPQKLDDIKEKTKTTCLEKYGVPHPQQAQFIKNKSIQTMIEQYGVDNPSKLKEVRSKATDTMMRRYGVSNPNLMHLTTDQISKLNNSIWLEEQLGLLSIKEIAINLNVNMSTIYDKIHIFNLDKFVNDTSKSQPEFQLIEFIKSLGYTDIVHGDRTIINPKELDIVIPSAKLAIEFCGLYWHSEKYKVNNYHVDKMIATNNAGYQLLTIFEDEYNNSTNIVRNIIKHKLGKTTDNIFARKTTCYEIYDIAAIKNFYDINHIQGWDKGSTTTVALTYDNQYVAMMSFEKYKDNSMYLTRYATSIHVIGGASKLFTYFLNQYPLINEIISFADRRWSNGNLYEKLGFNLNSILNADYRYVVNNERKHKFNYRKHHLKRLFGYQLDTDILTEKEVMQKMDMPRIWDCGKLKYVFKR